MNLPFFKKKSNSTSSREYLFSLEISHHLVKSAVWSVVNHKPQVLSVGCAVSWDDESAENLLSACDQTLSDAANHLDVSGHIQPDKVILGLPSDWIGPEKILPEKLALLKLLTEKLSLSPIGFVVTPEAVVRYLQTIEGVPPTTILLGIWPHYLEVTLLRLGNLEGIQLVKRSSKITSDVVEGLSRFTGIDMFPSRMLLYDSGLDLEDVKQQLLSHSWLAPQTHLPFLHFPKIEILPPDFTVHAISLAGGSEIAQSADLNPAPAVTEVTTSPQDLGFALDTDVRISTPVLVPVPTPVPALVSPPHPHFSFHFPKIPLPHPSFPHLPKIGLPLFIPAILVGVALLGAALLAAYWYLPRATVTLTVLPKSLSHQFDITADTGSTVIDLTNSKIPAQTVETTVSSEKTMSTSGTKLIGDLATGSVTIINGTPLPRTFSSGTAISSPTGQKYTFDSDVSVASASGSADPNSYQPGKATVKITAAQIGSDSNQTAGTQFKIGTYSALDYVAKNDAALSGGSSRQVGAVAKSDISKLRDDLTSSVRDQAKTTLLGKISASQIIIPESITLTTTSEEFDHKLDDIADQLHLKLSVKAGAIVLSKADLDQLVSDQIKSQLPENYDTTGQPTQKFTVKSVTANTTTLNLQISTSLLPRLNLDEIRSNIVGKQTPPALAYLQSLPGISRVDISFSPKLPDFILTLPRVSNHIKLEVAPGN